MSAIRSNIIGDSFESTALADKNIEDVKRRRPIPSYVCDQLVDPANTSKAYYLISGTGTGKSTIMPVALHRRMIREQVGKDFVLRKSKVTVTIPTRIAVESLYTSISSKYRSMKVNGVSRGREVGYVSDSIVHNPDATLKYITTESFMRTILSFYNKWNGRDESTVIDPLCDFLMVDEIHTGTIANEIILSVWSELLRASNEALEDGRMNDVPPVPYLLLASANDISVPILGIRKGVVQSPTKFVITTVFEEKKYKLNIGRNEMFGKPEHGINIYYDAGKQAAAYLNKNVSGHILVFGPGRAELDAIERGFNAGKPQGAYEIIMIRGAVSESVHAKLKFSAVKLVIFATNAAETSITIRDLGCVIDTLVEKNMYSQADESYSLVTEYISLNSSLQRKGRTGRTMDGIYHVMMSESAYKALKQDREQDILRIPLSHYILLVKMAGLNSDETLKRATPKRLKESNDVLLKVGAISGNDVTVRGIFCSKLPVRVQLGSFIHDGILNVGLYPNDDKGNFSLITLATIAAIVENYDHEFYDYKKTKKEDKKAYYNTYFAQYEGESSMKTLYNAWFALMEEINITDGSDVTREYLLNKASDACDLLSFSHHISKSIIKCLYSIVNVVESGWRKTNIPNARYTMVSNENDISRYTGLFLNSFPVYQRGVSSSNNYYEKQSYGFPVPHKIDMKITKVEENGPKFEESVVCLSKIRTVTASDDKSGKEIVGDQTDRISIYFNVPSQGLYYPSEHGPESNSSPRGESSGLTLADFENFDFNMENDEDDDDLAGRVEIDAEVTDPDYITYVNHLSASKNSTMTSTIELEYSVLGNNVIILDPKSNVSPRMFYTGSLPGSLGEKEDLPYEKYTFLLLDKPNKRMMSYIKERKMKTYSIVKYLDEQKKQRIGSILFYVF